MSRRCLYKAILIFVAVFLSLSPLSDYLSAADEPILAEGSSVQYTSSAEDAAFLKELRKALILKKEIPQTGSRLEEVFMKTSFPKNSYGFGIFVYDPGKIRLKAFSVSREPVQDIIYAVNYLIRHPRTVPFRMKDPELSRIQIDFIPNEPAPVKLAELNQASLDSTRFEVGVDGLMGRYKGKRSLYFPGDAYVKSQLYLNQLVKSVMLGFPNTSLDKVKFSRFLSESYVSYSYQKKREKWLRLYRGHPVMGPLRRADLEKAAYAGVDHLIKYQKKNGQFLYYYDAARDSYRDHEHPNRNPKRLYYNELRHAGGGLLLLYKYKITKDKNLLPPVRAAIKFLINTAVTYDLPDGREAAYFYYNKKAKLGASGIGLYLLSEYQELTGDKAYREDARRVANHITGHMSAEGEFLYYYVYLGKIQTMETNSYFSFYYPGEALIGLATYYKFVADEDEKPFLAEKIHAGLHFLLDIRPEKYKMFFQSLPSDSWLMTAINELWDEKEFRRENYKNYVYTDAKQMIDHSYSLKTALYPDYPGAFFYTYGDFPYADGARAEGIMGAYALAVKAGDKEQAETLLAANKQTAWATLHLVNTRESVYSTPNPKKSIGGIRFKHTRQWFRVDTTQHVAAFYLKFLPYLEKTKD